MNDTTYKVVVKDTERETVHYCTWAMAEEKIKLAEALGFEYSVSEIEEG